ncbi:hypothetical protein Droror1_Dr00015809 [Drosera rotundifolia]
MKVASVPKYLLHNLFTKIGKSEFTKVGFGPVRDWPSEGERRDERRKVVQEFALGEYDPEATAAYHENHSDCWLSSLMTHGPTYIVKPQFTISFFSKPDGNSEVSQTRSCILIHMISYAPTLHHNHQALFVFGIGDCCSSGMATRGAAVWLVVDVGVARLGSSEFALVRGDLRLGFVGVSCGGLEFGSLVLSYCARFP